MKKSDRKLLAETLDKALEPPPKRKPALASHLADYDEGPTTPIEMPKRVAPPDPMLRGVTPPNPTPPDSTLRGDTPPEGESPQNLGSPYPQNLGSPHITNLPIESTTSGESKTSFKTNTERSDDEALADFVTTMKKVAKDITGRDLS